MRPPACRRWVHASRCRGAVAVTALAALLIFSAGFACSIEPRETPRARVRRVIDTLSDDAMQGRRAFTASAQRAASFIAQQFRDAGLQPYAGGDGYLQRFSVRSFSVRSERVSLDGVPVSEDHIAARLGAPDIEWTPDHPPRLVRVSREQDPNRALAALRNVHKDTLVLVHERHAEPFARWRRFLARPSRRLDTSPSASVVLVLTQDTEPSRYRVQIQAQVQEQQGANVVGMIPGRRDREIVVFSSHYDHLGVIDPVDGDAIANGANDDASGTTAVIELAYELRTAGTPERTLVFAAFTAEETGGYGSQVFASRIDPEQVVAMFNLEMLGKVSAQGPGAAWITGFDRSDFGQILQRAVQGTGYTFGPDPYPDQNLFYRSDNATLARLGVPAHTISTTQIDIDPDYHQVSDEVSTLDLDHLTEIIHAIRLGAEPIIAGEATPTRIDPATVR